MSMGVKNYIINNNVPTHNMAKPRPLLVRSNTNTVPPVSLNIIGLLSHSSLSYGNGLIEKILNFEIIHSFRS